LERGGRHCCVEDGEAEGINVHDYTVEEKLNFSRPSVILAFPNGGPITLAMEAAGIPQQNMGTVELELSSSNALNTTIQLAIRRPFDPVAHDLDANFRLTSFAELRG